MLGILIGAMAGFYGGIIDTVIMRITEVFMTFPFILAAMTLSAILIPILGRGLWPATIALIVFGWMGYARLIRGDILSVRERDYVMAARVVGATDSSIMFKHIIPNAIYPTCRGFAGHRHGCGESSPPWASWGSAPRSATRTGGSWSASRATGSRSCQVLVDPGLPRHGAGVLCAGLEPGGRRPARHHGPAHARQGP